MAVLPPRSQFSESCMCAMQALYALHQHTLPFGHKCDHVSHTGRAAHEDGVEDEVPEPQRDGLGVALRVLVDL